MTRFSEDWLAQYERKHGKRPGPEHPAAPVQSMAAVNIVGQWIKLAMPPKISDYWRFPSAADGRHGQRFLTDKARRYRKSVWVELRRLGLAAPLSDRLRLDVVLSFSGRYRSDLDNRMKALQDALTWAKFWKDDSQIDVLHVERGPVVLPWGECRIKVIPWILAV